MTIMMKSTGMLSQLLRQREFCLPPSTSLQELRVPDSVIQRVPESVARDNCLLPVDFDGETLTCVTDQETDVMLQDKIRFILNCNVRFIGCDRQAVQSGINQYYGMLQGESADSLLQEFCDTAIDFTEMATRDEPELAALCLADIRPIDVEQLRSRMHQRDYTRSLPVRPPDSLEKVSCFIRSPKVNASSLITATGRSLSSLAPDVC